MCATLPDEFYKEMKKIADSKINEEFAHIEMDELMCRVLKELGYGSGVEIFEKADKWYS